MSKPVIIWKWPLKPSHCQEIAVPSGSKILSIHLQHNTLTIWVEVNRSEENAFAFFDRFEIYTYVTGEPFEASDDTVFFGTILQDDGHLVTHHYYRKIN